VPAWTTNAYPTDASRRRSDERDATSRPDECYATSCPTYSPRRFSLSLSLSLSSLSSKATRCLWTGMAC
jgi:hypothetical protein